MDSYLLTSTRTQCPRPLRPIPVPCPPPPAPSGWDSRLHLVALGIPPSTAAASRGHPAPLRGYSDPKRNGAFIPWREACEPSQPGRERRGRSPPCAAWGLGDSRLPILGSGALCHPLGCVGTLPSPLPWQGTAPRSSFAPWPSRSWERGTGAGPGGRALYPDIPCSSIPTPRAALASPLAAEPSLF